MEKHILENELPKGDIEDIGNSIEDFEIFLDNFGLNKKNMQ